MRILKNTLTLLFSGLCLLSITSCKIDSGGGELEAKVTPSGIYALPAKATSCVTLASGAGATPDLSAPSIVYNTLTLKWKDSSRSFNLAYLDLAFNSPSLSGTGKWDAVLADQELAAIFGTDGTYMAPMTDPSNPPTITSSCALKAGSVPLSDQNQGAFVTGQLKIVGFATDSDGNTTPVQVQLPISFQWQALQ